MSQWLHKDLTTMDSGLRVCPTCEADGEKESIIYPTAEPSTRTTYNWKPFDDSEGILHHHNPNRHTGTWTCTRGNHYFKLTQYNRCQICDWVAHETKLTRIQNGS